MASLLRELRRRKVYGVAVAYIAIAYGVLQAADFFLGDILEAPSWILRLLFACAVLGFPVALILSWVFNLTPQGIRRTERSVNLGEDSEQRLATIMATDLAAYDALLMEDPEQAIAVARQAAALIRDCAEETGGTPPLTRGDKSICLFKDPYQALLCAVKIQEKAGKAGGISLRIGISSGDVAVVDGELFGREIGITERLLKKVAPGGVVVSGHVRRFLPDQLSSQLNEITERESDDSPTAGIRAYRLTAGAVRETLKKQEKTGAADGGVWKQGMAALALLVLMFVILLYQRDWFMPQSSTPSASSVGVIPFVNLSDDPANEYFVDGLTEELIYKLSRIPNMQVPSRSLSFALKNLALDHDEIARRMNVGSFVEGTARFSRNTVKITVQLISTADGFHLWSEEYIARLDDDADMLQLHNRIALDVADSLKLALSPPQKAALEKLPTRNLDAWNAYIEGQTHLHSPRSAVSLQRAEDAFRRALALDAQYARAYAGLCRVAVERFNISQDAEYIPLARNNCNRARQIDADLLEVELAYGWLYRLTGDIEAGRAAFGRVFAQEPENVEAMVGAGWMEYLAGKEALAQQWFDRALTTSPNDPLALRYVAIFNFFEGRAERAAELFRRVVELHPTDAFAWSNLGAAQLRRGDDDAARAAFQRSLEINPTFTPYHNLGDIYYRLGDYRYAVELYRKALELSPRDLGARADLAATLYQLEPDAVTTQTAFEDVVELADALLEQRPQYTAGYYLRAYARAHLGDFDAAETDLDQALRLDPNDGTMHYYGAIVRTLENNPAAAFFHISEALKNGYPKRELVSDPTLEIWHTEEIWSSLMGEV